MRTGVHSATFGLFLTLALASANLCAQGVQSAVNPQAQVPTNINVDPCAIGRDPQPNVTRFRPHGRVWPGGKIVFEGQNLDPTRFQAAIGNAPQAIVLTIVAASPTRIEAIVPVRADGPYTPATGSRLTVAYKGAVGCRVLNPNFVVADAFTLRTHAAGPNAAYFWLRQQMNLDGNIEGARTIRILNLSDSTLGSRGVNPMDACDWSEMPRGSRAITLNENEFHRGLFGFVRDHRLPGVARTQPLRCKLPVEVVIQDPVTNISESVMFLINMIVRDPRIINVNTRSVLTRFQGAEPRVDTPGIAIGDCGDLYAGDPRGSPKSDVGVTVQNGDWVFTIRSGVLPTKCRYNNVPVEPQLGVAFGALRWETSKSGDASKCSAVTPTPANPHLLGPFQVYMSCDPGPLGDNGVTVRAASIDLMVPFEQNPPTYSIEAPN